MKLDKTARAILSVTALAWSIPFAQAAESRQPGAVRPQADSAAFAKPDTDRGAAWVDIECNAAAASGNRPATRSAETGGALPTHPPNLKGTSP